MKRLSILFTGILCLTLSAACSGNETNWGGASAELAGIFAKPKSKQNQGPKRPRSATPAFGAAPGSFIESISIEEVEALMSQVKTQKAVLLQEQELAKQEQKQKAVEKKYCFQSKSFLDREAKLTEADRLRAVWLGRLPNEDNKENRG